MSLPVTLPPCVRMNRRTSFLAHRCRKLLCTTRYFVTTGPITAIKLRGSVGCYKTQGHKNGTKKAPSLGTAFKTATT
ncbi:MAG TPA: hypothetical protein DDX19_26730 [Rhodopirellula baltica]|nr:hypothetical protein [Rhodopirellula baltica]